MKVLSMGSCNIDYIYEVDHIVRPGETQTVGKMRIVSGGKGLNQSIALAKAGVDVYHAGLVGADGGILREALVSNHVNCDYLVQVEEKSGHAIIQLDRAGENCILVYPGANHCFTRAYVDEVLANFERGDVLILQNEINLMDYIMTQAHQLGIQIVLNPAPFNEMIQQLDLSLVDYLILNEVEGQDLTGKQDDFEVLSHLKETYPQTHLILTRGAKGALYAKGDLIIEQSSFKVEAVDTTAAGDTFIGYLIYGIVSGQEIATSLELAAKASSITVTRKGSSSSIPTLDEVLSK